MQNLIISWEASELLKVGQDSMFMIDLYSSRCIHDPSFMALALIVSEKMI